MLVRVAFEALYHADLLHVINPHGDVGLVTLWSPFRTVRRKLEEVSPALLDPEPTFAHQFADLQMQGAERKARQWLCLRVEFELHPQRVVIEQSLVPKGRLEPGQAGDRGRIGAAELATVKPTVLIVNAARGAVIDTDALVAEVTTNRLRAVLDVTDPEPLPDGHPLWTAPGVLSITPHMAGDSPLGHRRAIDLAARQIARWLAGEELENVVPR